MTPKRIITPGEILMEEFIKPLNLTQKEVADGLGIPPSRLSEIVNGKLRISAEYALRLSLYFGMDVQTWLNIQNNYDRRILENTQAKQIRRQVKPVMSCCA